MHPEQSGPSRPRTRRPTAVGWLPNLPWLAIAALVLLLALLAGLQVRWLRQVAAAERQRLTAAAEDALLGLAQEVDTELSRAWLLFRRVPDEGEASAAVEGLRQVWMETAPRPGLIAVWVLISPSETFAQARVLRHDAATWEPLDGDLAARLRGVLEGTSHGTHATGPVADPGPLRPQLPGLLIPLAGAPRQGLEERMRRPPHHHPAGGALIVVFDRQELAERWLPELVERHAERIAGRGLEVRVSVARSGETIFASRPDLEGDFEWRQALFDLLPLAEMGRLAASLGIPGRDAGRWRGRIEDGPRRGRRGELAEILVQPPGWLLEARPAAGSLDAAVALARRGNALLGFGILFLLGLTVGALLLSTRRAQEMASRQLEFTAAVSHELRTPLAAIRSLGDNLADGVVRDGDQVRVYGEQIAQQSARLAALVEQVLALAAQRAVPMSGRPVDLKQLIQEAVSEENASAPGVTSSDATVAVELPEDAATWVSGDPLALRRALVNLIANARKHGRPPFVVRLRVAGEELRVEVRDHGPGIPAAERDRLFEPFFRGRAAQSGQIPGVGLGLHLVRRLVEAHGGRVEVDPAADGSTFVIILRRGDAP